MAKAKIAIVIVILALLQVSLATAARRQGGGTPAVMTVNGFQKGEEGGGPAACDGRFHSDNNLIVALSTRFFAGGKRCHKNIRITSRDTGRTVEAEVVDECDSNGGCGNNIVDSSRAVWKKLGLDTDVGEVPVTWSDANSHVMHRVGSWMGAQRCAVWKWQRAVVCPTSS